MNSEIRSPSLLDATVPIVSLVILLAGAVILYGSDATSGPTQVALILSAGAPLAVGAVPPLPPLVPPAPPLARSAPTPEKVPPLTVM